MCYSITGFVETLSNLFKGGTMMKVTVLVDNDTLVGMNFQVEPALILYHVDKQAVKDSGVLG